MIAGHVLSLALLITASGGGEEWNEHSGPAPTDDVLKTIATAKSVQVYLLGRAPEPDDEVPGKGRLAGLVIQAEARPDKEVARGLSRRFSQRSSYAPDTLCRVCTRCEDRSRVGLKFQRGQEVVDVVLFLPERFLLIFGGGGMRSSRLETGMWTELETLKGLGPEWAQALSVDPSAPPDRPSLEVSGFSIAHELPEVLEKTLPEYPNVAREAGEEGTVMVQARIREDGSVERTRIARSIYMLDDAAQAAVRQWKFRPAKCGGRPTSVWIAVPVKFTLTGPPPIRFH